MMLEFLNLFNGFKHGGIIYDKITFFLLYPFVMISPILGLLFVIFEKNILLNIF